MIGDNQLEFALEAESLRVLVTQTTAALVEMDTLFTKEEETMPQTCWHN